jgi:plastocyanin
MDRLRGGVGFDSCGGEWAPINVTGFRHPFGSSMGIKRGRVWWLVIAVLVGAAASPGRDTAGAQGGTSLHGRVRIQMPDGTSQYAQDAVVWLSGAAPPRPDPQQPGPQTSPQITSARSKMTSEGKRFLPHVVAISAGDTVDFPNVDRIFHNAFSVSPGNQFDLGLYRKGASKSHTFTTPGVVHVYCNIHQDMAGYVLVLPSARAVVTGADGGFRFTDVRPGRQTMKVWHPMSGEIEVAIDLQPGATRKWDVELDATRFRRAVHKNKFGKDYPPVRKDADRY